MPKIPICYSNTSIYKIVCKNINITECYIGHTTNFIKRKQEHKSSCNNIKDKKYNIHLYTFIRENGNWINWDMIEIEKYPCLNQLDAKKRERYWIETLKSILNSTIPTRTDKDNYNENKEKHLVKCKIYYEEHKDVILDYHKDYYIENKNKILDYHNKYREKNKEQITCCCGSIMNKLYIKTHEKRSKTHIQFIEQNKL